MVKEVHYKLEGRGFDSYEVIEFSTLPSASSHTVALELIQPRTETGDTARPAHKSDKLTGNCESIIQKMWNPRLLTILHVSTACYTDSCLFVAAHMPSCRGECTRSYHCGYPSLSYNSTILLASIS
jgi:hypothetical protein